jgi:hypothetical protein
MSAASTSILHYIKSEKRTNGLFDCSSHAGPFATQQWDKHAEALILLEDYAKTFERDMPLEVRMIMRKERHHYENLYSSLPVPNKLRNLNREYEEKNWDCFVRIFKNCFTLADGDFLEILEARKFLFDWDMTDRCCNIDPEITRCVDWMDWEVNEPVVTCKKSDW